MDPARLRRAPRGLARRARALADARELRRFRTGLSEDRSAPALLLSPHWDDAILNCWSLLTAERDVVVINVFGGVPSPGPARRWDQVCGGSEASSHAQARVAEDARALALAGRTPVNVPLLDAEYRAPAGAPTLSDLDAGIAEAAPSSVSAVYAPAALGMNVDHRLARRYARALHGEGIPVHLYADLPYCVVHGWPYWVSDGDPDPHRDVDAFWDTFLVDVPELGNLRAASVVHLEPARAMEKLAAMRAYETQFSALDGGAGILSNPAIHGFEVFWELGSRTAQPSGPN
jgi:LmbE family N-acetylglucosaminyl deacetylase